MAKWLWPCPGNNTITSGVGPRWGTQHKGIDISAPKGSPIISSREGEVIATYTSCTHNYRKSKSCGCGGGYGNYVFIDHKDGFITRYAHMTNVSVKVGDRLHQGKVIGTVGSTGFSTGNHLHFEIRNNDTPKDPELYVNPSNTISDSSYNNNLTDRGFPNSTSIANDYNNPITGDSVSVLDPVTVTDLTTNPIYAYFKIIVGDRELVYQSGRPNILQTFEMNRLEGAGNKAQFVLFDTNWDDIETYLASNWDKVRLQYGYTSGKKSPEYKMRLSDYSINFKNTGTILSIQSISDSVYLNLNPVESFDTGTKNPAEAIKKICEYIGIDVDMSDFASTKTVDRTETYKIINGNPITYINQVIIPETMDSEDNTETLDFYIDSVNNRAHLRVKTYIPNSNIEDESIPTYVYLKGYNSVVEDISFHIKGVFGGTSQFNTVTSLSSGLFSTTDKSERSVSSDQDTSISSASGNYSHTLSNQSNVRYVNSGETEDQMGAILNYYIKNGANQAYEATMTMLGDPDIELQQLVRIINITDTGHLHHTSGIYRVTGILDSIQNGNFRTILTLMRNADISTGIVLRDPKYNRK